MEIFEIWIWQINIQLKYTSTSHLYFLTGFLFLHIFPLIILILIALSNAQEYGYDHSIIWTRPLMCKYCIDGWTAVPCMFYGSVDGLHRVFSSWLYAGYIYLWKCWQYYFCSSSISAILVSNAFGCPLFCMTYDSLGNSFVSD